jgi:capsid protein
LSSPGAEERGGGAAVYAAYVAAQVAGQEARKSSSEQRGLAVITTSGVLVSLLFGLTAILTGAADYQLPEVSRIALLAALVFFVVAAIGGIVTNLPRSYRGVTADALKKQIDERWNDSAARAQREVALTDLKVIRRAKEQNSWKGRSLIIAIAAEILAVLCLAIAVGAILLN